MTHTSPGSSAASSGAAFLPAEHEILLGDGRSVSLLGEVGRGEVAYVYRAVVESPFRMRRLVACKVFDCVTSDDGEIVIAGLARVARQAALIRHPNVVPVHEFMVLDDVQPVLLSELVEGRSLVAVIEAYAARGRRLPLDMGLFIGAEVAEGLGAAREATTLEGARLGMLHLGLSAREVLISKAGEVRVTDFGVATALRPGSTVRSLHSLARRVSTMSPEVAQGERGDARSDVFALGILLREMLVGPRFQPDTSDAEAFELAREGHVDVGLFAPKLPSAVAAVLRRAIEIDPAARYPHAAALAYELRKVCLSLGVGDGRVFLRRAIHELSEFDASAAQDAPTGRFESGVAPRQPSEPTINALPRPRLPPPPRFDE